MVESGAYARLARVRELFASMLALALVVGITTGHISATCAWADEGSDGHAGLEADDGQDKNDLTHEMTYPKCRQSRRTMPMPDSLPETSGRLSRPSKHDV